jgi:hypothetical protein
MHEATLTVPYTGLAEWLKGGENLLRQVLILSSEDIGSLRQLFYNGQ